MSYQQLNDKLKELKTEDYIWIVYIGIIILSWYSNSLERKFYIYNDKISKDKYRKIMIIIFIILVIVYLYFLKGAVEDLRKLKPTDSIKKKRLVYLSFLGSLFVALSGFIFLFIAFSDQELDVELAFN